MKDIIMNKENLFITNYKEPSCSLMKSITELPAEEAYELAKNESK